MTNAYILSQCMISLFFIALMWTMIARQRREVFRSKIRVIRDDLFDFMWKNGYDYSNPVYLDMRQALNGIMVASNTLGPLEYIVIGLRFRNVKSEHTAQSEIEKIEDSALREKLEDVYENAACEWMKFLFLDGVRGLTLRGVFFLFRTFNFVNTAKQCMQSKADALLESAYRFGSPNMLPTKHLAR